MFFLMKRSFISCEPVPFFFYALWNWAKQPFTFHTAAWYWEISMSLCLLLKQGQFVSLFCLCLLPLSTTDVERRGVLLHHSCHSPHSLYKVHPFLAGYNAHKHVNALMSWTIPGQRGQVLWRPFYKYKLHPWVHGWPENFFLTYLSSELLARHEMQYLNLKLLLLG